MSRTAKYDSNTRRGVTLVELLVAIAIFIAIMGGVMMMFTSVTNTVRRSYSTMGVYARARDALLALERDVQTSFSAPAAGASLQFYGEPHGLVMIGVSSDNSLGRLTYVVHRDTSRMTNPGAFDGRGEFVTLPPRFWKEVKPPDNPADPGWYDLNAYYPGTDDDLVEFRVEVIYGLLLRFFETKPQTLERFARMENTKILDYMPRPFFTTGREDVLGAAEQFPWLSSYLWDYVDGDPEGAVSVPWHVRDAFELSEGCHYWIQLLHGPGLRPVTSWSLTNIWWNPNNLTDVFWNDPMVPNPNIWDIYPAEDGVTPPQLRDYVVSDGFVLETYLLDPNTGNRIMTNGGLTVPVLGPHPYGAGADSQNFDPIFRYAAEDRNNRDKKFNTLYNLDHKFDPDNTPAACAGKGAFECLSNGIYNFDTSQFNSDPGGPAFNAALSTITASRQFYDLGSPLQARMPASFDVTFWVISDSMVAGAPMEVYRFSQTVHLPAGHMRRSRVD